MIRLAIPPLSRVLAILLLSLGIAASPRPASGNATAGSSRSDKPLSFRVPSSLAASALNAPAIEFVNSLGGNVAPAAVAGNLAYVVEGSRLSVLDVSNPAAPLLRGRTSPIFGWADTYNWGDVAASGSRAYIGFGNTLYIVDASDPSAPILVGQYRTLLAFDITKVQVVGTRAYIFAGGLEVVDFSDPAHPRLLGKYDAHPVGGQVVGNLAYVVEDQGFDGSKFNTSFSILDLSDLAHPVERGSFALRPYGYQFSDVVVANGRAYIGVGGNNGIRLLTFDVTNPASPTLLANGLVSGYVQAVSGNLAYLTWMKNLQIWDISDPSNPILRSMPPFKADKVQIANGQPYISYRSDPNERPGGLWVLDVSDPTQPTVRGSYIRFDVTRVAVPAGGNLGYVVGDKFQVLDLTNPISPTLRGSYAEANTSEWVRYQWNKPLYVAGTQVYATSTYRTAADQDELRIFDVANPDAPVLRSSTPVSGTISGIVVENNLAYMLSYTTYSIPFPPISNYTFQFSIFDVSNPASPILRSRMNSISTCGVFCAPSGSIDLVGALAYVATGETLAIIDVADPANPQVRTQYDTPGGAQDVQVVGNLAYVADSGAGLTILDIQNPLSPTILGRYPGYFSCVQVKDNLAYLCSYPGLFIVDVSKPAQPRLRASYSVVSGPLQVAGDLIYVAGGEGGLQILRVHPDRFPAPAFLPLVHH